VTRLGDLSGPEWEEVSGTTVLLPVGSTEQHGPHLPMGTDSNIAQMVCEAAATQSGALIVAPSLPYGTSYHHHRLPGGAISLPGPLLSEVLVSLIDGFLRPDRRNAVIVVNGHGGNIPAILSALDEVGRRWGEHQVLACSWWDLIPDVMEEKQRSRFGGIGHAGEMETAVLLHATPDLVRRDRIPEGVAERPPGMPANRTFTHWNDFSAYFPEGVAGSPRLATPELGEIAIATAAERLVALAHHLAGMAPDVVRTNARKEQ
jgi:creatinine amidohydrolase/Fe(II)-dependent formamide hydrolase-like protein